MLKYFLQKEMFAAKVGGGAGGGGLVSGGAGVGDGDRKLSNSSGTGIKSKWVKAFKGIKMNKEDDMSDPRYIPYFPSCFHYFLSFLANICLCLLSLFDNIYESVKASPCFVPTIILVMYSENPTNGYWYFKVFL